MRAARTSSLPQIARACIDRTASGSGAGRRVHPAPRWYEYRRWRRNRTPNMPSCMKPCAKSTITGAFSREKRSAPRRARRPQHSAASPQWLPEPKQDNQPAVDEPGNQTRSAPLRPAQDLIRRRSTTTTATATSTTTEPTEKINAPGDDDKHHPQRDQRIVGVLLQEHIKEMLPGRVKDRTVADDAESRSARPARWNRLPVGWASPPAPRSWPDDRGLLSAQPRSTIAIPDPRRTPSPGSTGEDGSGCRALSSDDDHRRYAVRHYDSLPRSRPLS